MALFRPMNTSRRLPFVRMRSLFARRRRRRPFMSPPLFMKLDQCFESRPPKCALEVICRYLVRDGVSTP